MLAALAVTSLCYCDTSVTAADDDDDDPSLVARAQELLDKINKEYGEWNNKASIAAWNYASNLTDENLSVQLNVSAEVANYVRQVYKEVTEFPWENITDYSIRRQFKKLATPGSAALSQDVSN